MKPRTETKARTRTRTNLGTWQLVVVLSLMIVTWGCSGGGGGGGGAGAGAQNAPTLTFTGNSDGTISVIEVAADGKMTQHGFVDVGPFSVDALEVHPNGRFLFALSNDVLHVFTIDEKTLQFVDTLGIGGAAVELVISNSGRFGYIGRGGAQPAVITFSIDQSSGEVDNIDTLTTGDIPSVMVLDTPSNFLFALVGGQIQSFKLSNAGLPTLSAIRTPLDPPVGLTLSSGGDDLFVTTEFDDVYSYAVEADGSLVQNSVATNLGNAYSNLRHPILSADGDYLYALNLSQSTVVTLSVDESGAILGTVGNPQSTRGRGSAARLSADGSQLYVGNDASAVTVLELSGGAPSFSGEQMRVRSDVSSLAVRVGQGNAPRAPMLYVPNASDGTILAFRVENDGELNERAATPTGDGPRQVAFHPNGRFAYGLSHDSADVETFSVNTVTGALTSLDVVSLASVDPEQDLIRVTVDPKGRINLVLHGRVNHRNNGKKHNHQIDNQ
ncbi:MAG: beta-propeller fold lactonase family protein, partial [Planctomycetota bacterium]